MIPVKDVIKGGARFKVTLPEANGKRSYHGALTWTQAVLFKIKGNTLFRLLQVPVYVLYCPTICPLSNHSLGGGVLKIREQIVSQAARGQREREKRDLEPLVPTGN